MAEPMARTLSDFHYLKHAAALCLGSLALAAKATLPQHLLRTPSDGGYLLLLECLPQ
ncbi:hypothetical protein [Mesorhizobium sp.]|uniref:hypothetical protein n=1 Tax=Mesorhizobium sp. TaxID=1871066 RepID=UPI00257F8EE2|nr:hypothetical protein [Mesorhizobium sp.]